MSTNEIAGIGDNSSYQCIFDKEHTFVQCQMSFVSENQWVCNTFALLKCESYFQFAVLNSGGADINPAEAITPVSYAS